MNNHSNQICVYRDSSVPGNWHVHENNCGGYEGEVPCIFMEASGWPHGTILKVNDECEQNNTAQLICQPLSPNTGLRNCSVSFRHFLEHFVGMVVACSCTRPYLPQCLFISTLWGAPSRCELYSSSQSQSFFFFFFRLSERWRDK